jgi:hypothetical protein
MQSDLDPTDGPDTDPQEENAVLCLLTGLPIKASPREDNIQSLIRMMLEEYGFEQADMARDFSITGETDEGKKWKRRVELVIFNPQRPDYDRPAATDIVRLCVVQDQCTRRSAERGRKLRVWPVVQWPGIYLPAKARQRHPAGQLRGNFGLPRCPRNA